MLRNATIVVQNEVLKKEGRYMLNSKKIKGRMVELGVTQKDIAKSIGKAAPTVSQKINNLRPMDLEEAEKIAEILKISTGEFGIYFFV